MEQMDIYTHPVWIYFHTFQDIQGRVPVNLIYRSGTFTSTKTELNIKLFFLISIKGR